MILEKSKIYQSSVAPDFAMGEVKVLSEVHQSDWYLVAQLHNYRDGRRGTHQDDVHGATMQPFAATLVDDAAIVDVVAYINSLH